MKAQKSRQNSNYLLREFLCKVGRVRLTYETLTSKGVGTDLMDL